MAATTVTPDITTAPEPAPAATGGTLTSILAPVEPARPVKPIGSTASMAEESIASDSGKPGKQTEKNSGPVREHPIGALVRAIATRLARPSTSNHVKRQHTITESRISGGSSTTTNANRSNRDGKNHQIGQHRTARDAKVADNRSKLQQHQGRDQRDVKSADTRASTSASKNDRASRNGRDVKDHKDAKNAGTTTASKQDAVVHKTHRDGLDSRPAKTTDTTKKSQPTAAETETATKKTGTTPAPKDATTPKDQTATTKETKTGTDTTAKTSQGETAAAKASVDKTLANTRPRPRTQSSREAGYHDGTVAAKVTNHVRAYRDGVQDGFADGTAEYERDKRQMDDARAKNATKPDKPVQPAKQPASGSTADLAPKPIPADTKPEPQKAPANGSTADMAKKPAPTPTATPKPAPARGAAPGNTTKPSTPPYRSLESPPTNIQVNETGVTFDTDLGYNHNSVSRAEVRTLKGFERRMAEKVPRMQRVAEASKTARATAEDHATRVRRLAERARDVEGGIRLLAKLDRLAEHTDALRSRTEQVEKAALRGAESVRALVANAEVRHGGIYRAVADSPLTKPAEREFYQDKEGS